MFTTINKIKNADASKYIERLEQFEGSNFRAQWCYNEATDAHCYNIYSYRTLIAYVRPETGEMWLSAERFSNTTSRHASIVRAGFDAIDASTR